MNDTDELHVDEQVMTGVDYVVSQGEYYKVITNSVDGSQHFKRVDKIPEEYWERWDNDD